MADRNLAHGPHGVDVDVDTEHTAAAQVAVACWLATQDCNPAVLEHHLAQVIANATAVAAADGYADGYTDGHREGLMHARTVARDLLEQEGPEVAEEVELVTWYAAGPGARPGDADRRRWTRWLAGRRG